MARGRKWTDSEKAIARAGFYKGMTQPEIADCLPGRTIKAVQHILSEMGCVLSAAEVEERRVKGIMVARAQAHAAAQKRHDDAKVRRRFKRIDEICNSQPRPDQERMAAVLSDIAFRETYTAAAMRNGWIVRQIAA